MNIWHYAMYNVSFNNSTVGLCNIRYDAIAGFQSTHEGDKPDPAAAAAQPCERTKIVTSAHKTVLANVSERTHLLAQQKSRSSDKEFSV